MEQHDWVGRDPAATFALTGPVAQDRLLWRDRLGGVLPSLRSARLGLIVAPAGSGKSTLLGQLSSALRTPSGTYLAESADGSGPAFARRVAHALAPVAATVDPAPSTVDRLVDS